MIRLLRMSALALLVAATGSAYYHFVHYARVDGAYVAMPERFDLSVLPDRTVNVYVSATGPEKFASGDSFDALLGQLRFAVRAWNGAPGSDLRVGFGGLFTPGTAQNRPHIEVVFDELPPGVLAQGGPIVRAEAAASATVPFVPILTSVMTLRRDMSGITSNQYAMVLVHELGHALGLQHTFTASVMSQKDTRASTKGKPLADDDVAGVALLYPSAGFAASTGGISGRVAISGVGVHLASVVALTPTGQAVSALTAPDGSYRIAGLAPNQYVVYAHTLPPDAFDGSDIVLPLDPEGQSILPGAAFRTQFFPGAADSTQAGLVTVSAGADVPEINFDVQAAASPTIYDVATVSYFGYRTTYDAWLNSAVINFNGSSRLLVATGKGLLPGGQLAPGLSLSILGNSVRVNSLDRYTNDYILARFGFELFTQPGPRHLVFSTPGEVYVRPSGLTLVEKDPPKLNAAALAAEDVRTLNIQGENLGEDTRILVDGLPAQIASFDAGTGTIVAAAPAAAPGYRASVVAVNGGDGQVSEFAQEPLTYDYDHPSVAGAALPSIVLSQASLPAGAEALIDVFGANAGFLAGETQICFGSSDITVKRVVTLDSNHLQVEVAVSQAAPASAALVTVMTGLQTIIAAAPFEILPLNPFQLSVDSTLVNPAGDSSLVYPGGLAAVNVSNLPEGAVPSVALDDVAVEVVSVEGTQIVFRVPSSAVPGLAVLRIQAGAASAYPVLVEIGKAPPAVLMVWRDSSLIDQAFTPAHPGDLLTVYASGLEGPDVVVDAARLRVTVAGVSHEPVFPAHPVSNPPDAHQIQFLLDKSAPEGLQPLTVTVDNRTSAEFTILIKNE